MRWRQRWLRNQPLHNALFVPVFGERLIIFMLRVAIILFAFAHLASANDSARIALTSLCDPAKIAALT